jgi:anti-sigma regulatory factor (Ser/Thr protein kinase)
MGDKIKGSFDLVFRPSLDLISVVRRFVHEFYQEVLHVEAGSQLALATHELLENAVKYGVDGETRLSIEVTEERAGNAVLVRTVNRTEQRHIDRVRELFAEMERTADPFAFYQVMMRRSLTTPNESGLGIARIAAEADMRVTHELVDGTLTILARTLVSPEVAS